MINLTNKIANDMEIKSQLTRGKSEINTINSKEELLESIRNQDFRLFPDEAAVLNRIIKDSILRENELSQEIENLMSKVDKINGGQGESNEKTKNLKENSKNVKASNDPQYYIKVIDEVRDLFKEEISRFEIEIKDLNTKVLQLY